MLAFEPLGKDVATPLGAVGDVAHPAADEAADQAHALSEHFRPFAFFIGGGFNETAFEPVAADITVKGKLESGVGGVVLIVPGKGFEHGAITVPFSTRGCRCIRSYAASGRYRFPILALIFLPQAVQRVFSKN